MVRQQPAKLYPDFRGCGFESRLLRRLVFWDGNKLGKKIKNLRTGLGLSQDELARKADVPYTTLTKIETGVIKKPSVYVVAKIAKALKTSLDNLIE